MSRTVLYALVLAALVGCQSTSQATSPPATPTTPPPQEPAQTPPPAVDEPAQPAPEAETKKAYDEGPLRTEVVAMREIRLRFVEAGETPPGMESDFRMQIRVAGTELSRVKRFGNAILTEVVDDQGTALVDDKTYSEQERTQLRKLNVPLERLKETGLLLTTRSKEATRGAKTLPKVRGTVRLILADKTESYTILNPLRFQGATVEEPRLQQRGIEVRFVPAEELDPAPPPQCLVLQFKKNAERVESVVWYDAWMQRMPYRERPLTTKSGEECTAYCFQATSFSNEMQLVIEAYPEIQDLQVPINLDNLALP